MHANTWRQLLEILKDMESNKDSRLDDTLTIHCTATDEFFPALLLEYETDGILPHNHLFITTVDWNGEL